MDIDTLHRTLALAKERRAYEKWRFFVPVPKQEEFIAATETHSECLLMAGNGNGKTETAAYAISRWMTGEYPLWWQGRKFTKPTRGWLAGSSLKEIAEAGQTKLLGPPGQAELFGTGLIPKEAIVNTRPARGYPDAVESIQVKCKINGKLDDSAISRVVTKTYSQEREDWQGAEIDWLWPDEEPPAKLLSEGIARLRGRGVMVMTFTPMLGMTPVVMQFMEEENPDRYMVRMGINDATWYPPEVRRRMIQAFPAHEREARSNGDPMMGSGRVFRVPESDIKIPPIPFNRIPPEWPKIWGIDFGGNSDTAHPFAAVLYAWDREATVAGGGYNLPHLQDLPPGPIGTVYILHAIRMTNSTILQHADAMKRVAADVPVAWPHDGHEKDRNSGDALAEQYKKHGLRMLESHATHPSGGYSTYAGILDMDTYMQARQFKVFDILTDWLREYGEYHYNEKNLLVKVRDDLMSATRIAHMMRRRARSGAFGARQNTRNRPTSRGQLNPWTGRVEQREGIQTWR